MTVSNDHITYVDRYSFFADKMYKWEAAVPDNEGVFERVAREHRLALMIDATGASTNCPFSFSRFSTRRFKMIYSLHVIIYTFYSWDINLLGT